MQIGLPMLALGTLICLSYGVAAASKKDCVDITVANVPLKEIRSKQYNLLIDSDPAQKCTIKRIRTTNSDRTGLLRETKRGVTKVFNMTDVRNGILLIKDAANPEIAVIRYLPFYKVVNGRKHICGIGCDSRGKEVNLVHCVAEPGGNVKILEKAVAKMKSEVKFGVNTHFVWGRNCRKRRT